MSESEPDEIAGWLAQGMIALASRTDNGPRLVKRHGWAKVARKVARGMTQPSALLLDHAHLLPLNQVVPLLTASRASLGRFRVVVVTEREIVATGPLSGVSVVHLPDYSHSEAVNFMIGWFGAAWTEKAERQIRWLGGVPALLEGRAAMGPSPQEKRPISVALRSVREEVLSLCESLGSQAVHRVATAEDWLPARAGDHRLIERGLLVQRGDVVRARAPLFAEMALMALPSA